MHSCSSNQDTIDTCTNTEGVKITHGNTQSTDAAVLHIGGKEVEASDDFGTEGSKRPSSSTQGTLIVTTMAQSESRVSMKPNEEQVIGLKLSGMRRRLQLQQCQESRT